MLRIIDLFLRKILSKDNYFRYKGVKIGKGCNIQNVSFGSEPYLVTIGNNVQITSGVKFFTHGGGWIFRTEYPKFDTFGKIEIADNVYIGNNVLILPGIKIANNTIIAAGSVVTKSITEPGNIVGGNPAKVIGKVDDLKKRLLSFNLNTKGLNPKEKKRFLLSLDDDKFITK